MKKNPTNAEEQLEIANARGELFMGFRNALAAGSLTQDQFDARILALNTQSAGGQQAVDPAAIVAALERHNTLMDCPWTRIQSQFRAAFEAYEMEAAKTDEASLEELKKEVYMKARDNALAPMEVMALMYLLFLNDNGWSFEKSSRMLALLILRTPLDTRFLLHNWGAVSPNMNPGDVLQHGEKMTRLQYPLFPPTTCASINAKIFYAQGGGGLVGGSAVPNSKALNKFYRDEEEDREVLMGGAKGSKSRTAYVEGLEKEIAELKKKVGEQEREISRLQDQPRQTYVLHTPSNGASPGRQERRNGAWRPEARPASPKN